MRLLVILACLLTVMPAQAQDTMRLCRQGERNGPQKHCVVDGDTVWFHGQNLRLEAFDTPETHTQICGGDAEVALGKQAANRLVDLLNANSYTVETFGLDGTGKRILATIRINGQDVGDILIAEGLARRWPDGREFWC